MVVAGQRAHMGGELRSIDFRGHWIRFLPTGFINHVTRATPVGGDNAKSVPEGFENHAAGGFAETWKKKDIGFLIKFLDLGASELTMEADTVSNA